MDRLFTLALVVLLFANPLALPAGVAENLTLFIDSGRSFGPSYNRAVALGDLDGDGDLDALVASSQGGSVWLNSAGTFWTTGQVLGVPYSTSVALGDLDNDGDLDAFIGYRDSWSGRPDKVWLNDGTGNFQVTDQSLGMQTSSDVLLGDVDRDGDLDAFVAACGNDMMPGDSLDKLWVNDGTAYFADSGQFFSGDVCSASAAMGDLNGDQNLDLVIGRAGGDIGIEIWLNSGMGVFSQTQVLQRGYNFDLALGDLDGDQDLDLFVANGDALGGIAPNTVWLNDGSGAFTDSGQRLGSAHSEAVALGDLDSDGDLDAFVVNGYYLAGQPDEVWWNDGSANFHDSKQRLGKDPGSDVALGDMDQDGDLDAFVAEDSIVRVWANVKVAARVFLPLTLAK